MYKNIEKSVAEIAVLKGILDDKIEITVKIDDKDDDYKKEIYNNSNNGTYYRYAVAKFITGIHELIDRGEISDEIMINIDSYINCLNEIGLHIAHDGMFICEEEAPKELKMTEEHKMLEIFRSFVVGINKKHRLVNFLSGVYDELCQLEINFMLICRALVELSKGTFDEYDDKFIEHCNQFIVIGPRMCYQDMAEISNKLNLCSVVFKKEIEDSDMLMIEAMLAHLEVISRVFLVMQSNNVSDIQRMDLDLYDYEIGIIENENIDMDAVIKSIKEFGRISDNFNNKNQE